MHLFIYHLLTHLCERTENLCCISYNNFMLKVINIESYKHFDIIIVIIKGNGWVGLQPNIILTQNLGRFNM